MWVTDGAVPVPLYDSFDGETGPAFLLPDGRAFFTGSPGTSAYYTPSGTASPGTWAAGPVMPGSQGVPDAAGAMMVNGKILLAVSFVPYGPGVYPSPTGFFEFDYLTNTFTGITVPGGGISIAEPCYYTDMLDLPDGSILLGNQGSAQYYEYVPDGAPLAAGKPVISNVIKIACDTYKITGTQFNGITEGASYGDDWQMASNYPIVRLSAGGNVYYAFSFKWNSTGVMRGSAPDTAFFVLPAGLPNGTYDLEVVANGNPSSPHTFTTCNPALGVEQPVSDKGSIHVYPNPASGQATVVFNAVQAGNFEMKMLDVFGRVVRQKQFDATNGENKQIIDLSGIARGIYTVVLNSEDAAYKTRLVVE